MLNWRPLEQRSNSPHYFASLLAITNDLSAASRALARLAGVVKSQRKQA
jgi:hypothetical protein